MLEQLQQLVHLTGFGVLEWRMVVMWVVVLVLLWLAVYKGFEPLLLIPIAFGALLANLPTENLVEKPAGPVRSPVTGTVFAAMASKGDVITIERVPHERPDHLIRLKPDEIRDLFANEARHFAEGNGSLLFVVHPDKPTPTDDGKPRDDEAITVPYAGGEIQVTPDDYLVWAASSGRIVADVPAIGSMVIDGQQITEMNSTHAGGFYHWISLGVILEIFPPIIFLGVGALTDFGPLIANPRMLLLGAAAQLGVFVTFLGAIALGFSSHAAAAIGIIGGADGPTSIFLSNALAPELMAPIAVAAYSYMALVPVIQPPIMNLLTTKEERKIRMKSLRKVSRLEKLIFALAVTILCILLVPPVAPLIAMLMLGNFLRECGVTERLTKAAQNEIINIVTIFLGTSVGITMQGDRFLRMETMMIIVLGVIAFGVSTAGGLLMARVMNLFSKNKINPLIGSAGVSAVPMAARVSHTEGLKADPHNYLLMHAMGPNVAGVIGTALAAGYFLALLGGH
ncbi:sodium ion-translocating decarboxylase subunit beta [Haloferula sargassicola]|uniref:Glutaconyl-CoA decarboxylase subunit beta n=1 Tax=Haloferula sargassicola TaxID=490096 RepID=A0ABP9UT69_9BACT